MKQIIIALDQLINTVFGGWADETLSARAWRQRNDSRGWQTACRWIDRLFFWEQNHCEASYRAELLRSQLPRGYRQ